MAQFSLKFVTFADRFASPSWLFGHERGRFGWHVYCSEALSIVRSISTRPVAEDDSGRAPERRHHHRALVGASAWLVVDDQRFDAECVNVSMGGAAVFTAAAPSIGAHVRFELSLGMDRGSIAIEAEVVRGAPGEVGLRFLELDRASLEALLALV